VSYELWCLCIERNSGFEEGSISGGSVGATDAVNDGD